MCWGCTKAPYTEEEHKNVLSGRQIYCRREMALDRMQWLQKEIWHEFVIHKHNHDCTLAQGRPATHMQPLSLFLTHTHTHTLDDFPPDSLSSTVEHMSFVCRPSSTLTERHSETLIS